MLEPGLDTHEDAAISVKDLSKLYTVGRGLRAKRQLAAVKDVSFSLPLQQTLGIVGESGCGKTTLTRLLLGLERQTTGSIWINEGKGSGGKRSKGSIQAVFQDPSSSLNPRMRVEDILAEPARVLGIRGEERSRAIDLALERVSLPVSARRKFAHEFSGGQRQRIAIARSIVVAPRLVVLDEPVSALDVSVRGQVLNLLKDLQDELQLTYVITGHDLQVIEFISDKILVMYLGEVVEYGPTSEVIRSPSHPYTVSLIQAMPPTHPSKRSSMLAPAGEVPSPIDPPEGCRFHPRCPFAKQTCKDTAPRLVEHDGREIRCHMFDPEYRDEWLNQPVGETTTS